VRRGLAAGSRQMYGAQPVMRPSAA
jgi:hypothetical protein